LARRFVVRPGGGIDIHFQPIPIMKTYTLLAVSTVLLIAGCATPEARIKKNPAAFDQATSAQQELIKRGEVAVGFTPELVELAMGAPDKIWERTDTKGKSTVWSYVTYETTGGVLLYRGWYHRWCGPQLYPYYMDYGDRREHERVKVTFEGGRVTAIEEEK
jgi:hypothetical protein